MIWKIKNLILTLDYLLANFFFSIQSSFIVSVIQFIKNIKYSNKFPIVKGNINITEEEANELIERLNKDGNHRGDSSKKFSLMITVDDNNSVVKRLREKVQDTYIKKYFGKHKKSSVIIRNFNFDKTFETSEVYSNKWHLDSDLGFRQCKIFLRRIRQLPLLLQCVVREQEDRGM